MFWKLEIFKRYSAHHVEQSSSGTSSSPGRRRRRRRRRQRRRRPTTAPDSSAGGVDSISTARVKKTVKTAAAGIPGACRPVVEFATIAGRAPRGRLLADMNGSISVQDFIWSLVHFG